jgi:hypothetical protein
MPSWLLIDICSVFSGCPLQYSGIPQFSGFPAPCLPAPRAETDPLAQPGPSSPAIITSHISPSIDNILLTWHIF